MKIKLLIILLITAVVSCTSGNMKMDTTSMEPTLAKGEKISVEQSENVNRQDIVAFNYNHPNLGKKIWVFRVIGVPGDTIEIKQGMVYINGAVSEEPYTKLSDNMTNPGVYQPEILGSSKENGWNTDNYGPVAIPLKGEKIVSKSGADDKLYAAVVDNQGQIEHDLYFVMGDSRHDAYDSRFIGFVPKSEIVGVVKK